MTQFVSHMDIALDEARKAALRGEVPVGAVVMSSDGGVIAQAGNQTRELNDPTAHAEVLAIRAACAALGQERLTGCDLYVTLEPCPMCAGAAFQSRVDRVVFGAVDPDAGACASLYNIGADARLNHEFEVTWRVREDECVELLTTFFEARR